MKKMTLKSKIAKKCEINFLIIIIVIIQKYIILQIYEQASIVKQSLEKN